MSLLPERGPLRAISVLLLAALCLSLAPAQAQAANADYASYVDLRQDVWYTQGVRFCLENELMSGYRYYGLHFFPEQEITRGQLVTTLWRMDGAPETGLAMHYIDVPEGSWYEGAVRWALAEDIMDGYTSTMFAPGDAVTREQFATILWRYARHISGAGTVPDADLSAVYSDWDRVSDYAAEPIQWACGMGWPGGRQWIKPAAVTTRAAAAVMLMRFCLDFCVCEKTVS